MPREAAQLSQSNKMKNCYAAKIEGEVAKVLGKDLPISTKHSMEICRFLRKRKLNQAKELLKKVMLFDMAVPYKVHIWDLGHKKGAKGPGRYPIKACKEILRLLEAVETNAQFKGMNTGNLIIEHICAHKASSPHHYGRQRGQMKRCHIEIIVKEGAKEKEIKKETKGSGKK